jgi:hypothetical protein
MTTSEINSEIAKNIAEIQDLRRKVQSNYASMIDWQRKYDTDKKKSPEDLVTIKNRASAIDRDNATIVTLLERNIALNKQLETAQATAETLAKQGKTISSVEKDAEAKAKAVEKKAETEAKIIKDKADSELAKQQMLDNEMALKMAKETAKKGMNPILKISLISLGVAGALIGGYLLVKKLKK